MRILQDISRIILVGAIASGIFACGGGGGSGGGSGGGGGGGGGVPVSSISSFELIDPTPRAGDQFGQLVAILTNGNIVVSDPYDSSIAANNGAVHLYDPVTQTLIASIYGEGAGDQLGFGSITALTNNNFVVASPVDNLPGIAAAGSVRLVNGATGAEISMIAGDDAADGLGLGGITALANGNYVISSWFDTVAGVSQAGSIRLVNGVTGIEIPGGLIAGDDMFDNIGSSGVIELANGNYVIASPADDAGAADNGSVRLVNGTTGVGIAMIAGDDSNDQFGLIGVTALANGTYVLASPADNLPGIATAGTVRLVDTSGAEVFGSVIEGDSVGDQLGVGGVITLANGDYVIASPADNEGATDNGSVRLVDGATGVEVPGGLIVGDGGNDGLGFVTALPNSNYVIGAPFDDVGGAINGGTVRLVNGATGVEVPGGLIAGITTNDRLGLGDTIALGNNNFVVASYLDNEGGVSGAGSVRLVNGTTGLEINMIAGTTTTDQLGSGGITALASNNFIMVSPLDDDGGVNFGSVRLVDGATGIEIGTTLTGNAANDLSSATVTVPSSGDYYILGFSFADNNALADSGLVRLIAP